MMEIEEVKDTQTQQQQPLLKPNNFKKGATFGKYVLIKTLGSGYNSKVKLGLDPVSS